MIKILFVPLLTVGVLAAAIGTSEAAPVKIRIGYATAASGPHAAGAHGFEEELERLAPGEFEIEHFPGGSLGGEREMAEGTQLGSLEMAVIGSAVIGNFVPAMMVADMPFLFRDYEHARTVLDGPIGDELLEEFRSAGFVGLAFGEIGFRHLTTNGRAVRSVEDLKGLKIRTMENEVHLAAFRSLGALPTPMAWTEVLTGLQQGTIDGQENPMSVIQAAKLWEMQEYVTLSNHVFTPVAFIASPTLFDRLSPEDQEKLQEAAVAGAEAMRTYVDKIEQNAVEELTANGMEVVTDLDTADFQRRMEPIYAEFGSQFGDLIERIRGE